MLRNKEDEAGGFRHENACTSHGQCIDKWPSERTRLGFLLPFHFVDETYRENMNRLRTTHDVVRTIQAWTLAKIDYLLVQSNLTEVDLRIQQSYMIAKRTGLVDLD